MPPADRPPDVRLRPPRLDDEAAVMAAHAELAKDDFEFAFLGADETFAEFVQSVADHRRGRHLRDGWVESTWLVAVVDREIVGRTSIRFELNDFLREEGGHIGYGVRPAWRGRGYATEILRQSVVIARAGDVDEVLITCDDDNSASTAVIERCGGELESIVRTATGRILRRYWIR